MSERANGKPVTDIQPVNQAGEGPAGRLGQVLRFFEDAKYAKHASGKGYLQQAIEIAKLRAGFGKIGPGDYYNYRLYDPRLSDDEKTKFIGWHAEAAINNSLNVRAWHSVANDKILFQAVMDSVGIALPKILLIYHPGGRTLEGAATTTTQASLADYLRTSMTYPFFTKPVAAGVGLGAALVDGYRRETDEVVLGNGTTQPLERFCAELERWTNRGQIFQELVRPHPAMLEPCGPRLSTLRIMLLLTPDGPRIHRVALRLALSKNMVDNFQHGASGNLLAEVDPTEGRIVRVVGGLGRSHTEFVEHPETKVTLPGVVLPDWQRALAMLEVGARALPGLRFQHWDIALSDRGPIALEVNCYDVGGTDAAQLLGRGTADEAVRAALGALRP